MAAAEAEGSLGTAGKIQHVPIFELGETPLEKAWSTSVAALEPFLLPLDPATWPCLARWAGPDGDIDEVGVIEDIGFAMGPVYRMGSDRQAASYAQVPAATQTVQAVLGQLPPAAGEPEQYAAALAAAAECPDALPYLKDCHLALRHPTAAAAAYATPPLFGEDVLNWWWTGQAQRVLEAVVSCELPTDSPLVALRDAAAGSIGLLPRGADDYKFLYLGSAATFTPTHHDIVCSHSWSAQVAGRKLWLLWHPDATSAVADAEGVPRFPDATRYMPVAATSDLPTEVAAALVAQAEEGGDGGREVQLPWGRAWAAVQEPGTAMFVPSGWYHQVLNLSHSLSINHNWMGTAALPRAGAFVAATAASVRRHIDDCRTPGREAADDAEWHFLCERMQRADCGMNLQQWSWLLHLLAATLLPAAPGLDLAALCPIPPARRSRAHAVLVALADALVAEPLVEGAVRAQCEGCGAEWTKAGLCLPWSLPQLLEAAEVACDLTPPYDGPG